MHRPAISSGLYVIITGRVGLAINEYIAPKQAIAQLIGVSAIAIMRS